MSVETDIMISGLELMENYPTSLPVFQPNRKVTPPSDGSMYLKVDFFPNETQEISWDDDGRRLYIGAFQISVYFPLDSGLVLATEEAEKISALFAKGTALGPARVSGRASIAPAIYEDTGGFIPVTIPYRGIA